MPNWNEILKEISSVRNQAGQAFDLVRKKYLGQLHDHTGRNIIVYYSGWLSKPTIGGLQINDEDKNGFMMAVHGLDKSKGLDLVLHTPGGAISATQSLSITCIKCSKTTFGRLFRKSRCPLVQ